MPDDYVKPSDIGYVIYQQQTMTVADDRGGYEQAVVVPFKTPGGNLGKITIPVDAYSAQSASAAVIAAGTELDGL